MGPQRHARAHRAQWPRDRTARGRARLTSSAARILVVAGNPRERRRLEAALANALSPRHLEVERDGARIVVLADPQRLTAIRRAHRQSPILVLLPAAERRRVASTLDKGADAVLLGHLRARELRARVRALARRVDAQTTAGALTLDRRSLRMSYRGASLTLSPAEFALLACFAECRGSVVGKDRLLVGAPRRAGGRTLERNVGRLRRRLRPVGLRLVTVWGVGYRLERAS